MYNKLVVVCLISVVVCDSIAKDDQQPAATNNPGNDEEGKRYGIGFSKKFGYNKMIVATYLGPVPVEASESYTNYVIHPINAEQALYHKKESKDNLEENPIVMEDTAETMNVLKLFPIVVEDNERAEESKHEPNKDYKGFRELAKEEDGDSYGSYYAIHPPKGKNVLDEEIQDMYLKWFEKDSPKDPTGEEHFASIKTNLDDMYAEGLKRFFNDEDDDDKNEYTEETKNEKQEDDYSWLPAGTVQFDNKEYTEETKNVQQIDGFDWLPAAALQMEFEDKSADESEKKKKELDLFIYEPKSEFKRSYYFDDNQFGYRWWSEW